MDGEVVHALLGLLDQGVAEDLPGQLLGLAVDFFQSLVDGHGADGHGRVADDPLAGFVDMLAGGQVHHGIAAPVGGPDHLLHFLGDAGADGAVADVGIDLHQEVAADDHRLQFGVVDVGRDDGAATGHFAAHEFGGDQAGDVGAEGFAAVALEIAGLAVAVLQLFQAGVFTDGDVFHLRGDDAAPGVVHLADVGASFRPQRLADVAEAEVAGLVVRRADAAEQRAGAAQFLGIAALGDPAGAQRGQAGQQVDGDGRVGIGAAGVVDGEGRVGLLATGGVGGILADLAHGDAEVRARAFHIDLAAFGEGLAHFGGEFGRLLLHFPFGLPGFAFAGLFDYGAHAVSSQK